MRRFRSSSSILAVSAAMASADGTEFVTTCTRVLVWVMVTRFVTTGTSTAVT